MRTLRCTFLKTGEFAEAKSRVTNARAPPYNRHMSRSQRVLEEALELTEEQRAEIALRLLESIPPSDTRTDDDWIEEVERRAARVISGESKGSPWSDVRARIESNLKK